MYSFRLLTYFFTFSGQLIKPGKAKIIFVLIQYNVVIIISKWHFNLILGQGGANVRNLMEPGSLTFLYFYNSASYLKQDDHTVCFGC